MKKFLFLIICTLMPLFASAQEPYAILIDNGTALEFRYDNDKSAYRDAMDIGPFTEPIQRGWDLSTENIRSIVFNQSFANCTSITSTAYWFAGMTNLETFIGLEYLNTSNVTAMNGMFWVCSALRSLDLSNFNTQNVSNMSNMFTRCSRLATIKVGNGWSTSNVSSSSEMFEECTSLVGGSGTTYDSSHTDASYAHIDGGSSNPGYLTSSEASQDGPWWQELRYTIDYGVDVLIRARSNDNVEPWMIEELEHFLERGNQMYNEHTADEEEVRWMVEELNMIIREVEEAMNRPASGDPEPYAVLSENNTVLTFYYDTGKDARGGMDVGPFIMDRETGLNRGWEEYRGGIQTVVFDESFANCTSITSTSYWFYSFSHLETVVGIENLNTSNVTEMHSMFDGCSRLTSIDVSHFNTSNVTNMDGMFSNCQLLETLDVSNFNTSKVEYMAGMFIGCYNLTLLDVSHFNTSNVVSLFSMFGYCRSLTSIDVSHFNTSKVPNMLGMFQECSSLTSLDLSSFDTSNVTLTRGMFANCSNLTTIYVSSSWSTGSITQSEEMFTGCEKLVGGRGTTYNANHTDAAYAHIDGGTANPGYLTDINGSGSSDLEQRRAELLDMIEQLVQQIDVCAYELSRKDPQRTSDLWAFLVNIEEAIYDVRDRTERAESDAELDECEERIRQIREEIDYLYMRIAEYAVGDASFDGLTARVSGSATLDDAFESVGGRAVAAQTIAAIVWNADDALTADMLTGINNPNLLVFVTEASKAPSGVQNVVINGTAAEIVLTDASGNNNFYCPQSFTAQSISYTRNFSQTTQIDVCQGWETISLPFAVQSIRHQTHGALTPFGGGNNGYPFWLRQLSSSGLSRATAIEANRPYLICMPNNTVYPSVYNQAGNITFSATNVTVPVTTEQTASGADVTLRPAFQQVAQSSSVYALNVGEARGNNPEGSVFEQNYRAIRPFQAYTTHSSGTRFITLQSLGLGGDDTTGIEAIDTEEADDGNAIWHTLDGRRLEGKPTKKGVYIKDGRKYIIK